MVSKQTLVLLLLVALLCVVDSRAKPRAPKQRPMKNQIAGQWIITSIIGYPLAITVRFDTNDIHFKYGNNKVIDYTITGTNNIRYKLRKTIRKPNNLSNPTQAQLDNVFATASTFQYSGNDFTLFDPFGQVVATFVRAAAYKSRPVVQQQPYYPAPRGGAFYY